MRAKGCTPSKILKFGSPMLKHLGENEKSRVLNSWEKFMIYPSNSTVRVPILLPMQEVVLRMARCSSFCCSCSAASVVVVLWNPWYVRFERAVVITRYKTPATAIIPKYDSDGFTRSPTCSEAHPRYPPARHCDHWAAKHLVFDNWKTVKHCAVCPLPGFKISKSIRCWISITAIVCSAARAFSRVGLFPPLILIYIVSMEWTGFRYCKASFYFSMDVNVIIFEFLTLAQFTVERGHHLTNSLNDHIFQTNTADIKFYGCAKDFAHVHDEQQVSAESGSSWSFRTVSLTVSDTNYKTRVFKTSAGTPNWTCC